VPWGGSKAMKTRKDRRKQSRSISVCQNLQKSLSTPTNNKCAAAKVDASEIIYRGRAMTEVKKRETKKTMVTRKSKTLSRGTTKVWGSKRGHRLTGAPRGDGGGAGMGWGYLLGKWRIPFRGYSGEGQFSAHTLWHPLNSCQSWLWVGHERGGGRNVGGACLARVLFGH